MPLANTIALSLKQQEVLQELGIIGTQILIIKGDQLKDFGLKINGYSNGHYLFFLNGTAQEHSMFLRHLYGPTYVPTLPLRFRDITVYGSPTQKFLIPENFVEITTELNTTTTIQY